MQRFDEFIERFVHVCAARAAVHNVVGARSLLGVGELARQQMLELLHRHARPCQHALALHLRGRGQRDRHVDALLGAGLEQKRDLQHRELRARVFLRDRKSISAATTRGCTMASSRLQPCLRARQLLAEQLAVDLAAARDAGKGRLDRPDGLAFIEAVHPGIGVEHRHAAAREMLGRRRLAHADGAGEADDEHHAAPSDGRDVGPERCGDLGAHAKPVLESRHRLMQQHAKTVDHSVARSPAPPRASGVSSGL